MHVVERCAAWALAFRSQPLSPELLLHAPRFETVALDLGNGRTLTITAPGADGRKLQYVEGVSVNGAAHDQVWLDWAQMREGGTIALRLTDAPPATGWGTGVASLPVAPCALPH